MKKMRGLVMDAALLMFCMVMFSGCGSASYDADRNTVFVLKNGEVVSTDVGSLPAKKYDEKEFEKYVNDAIASYTKKNGEGSVELEKLSVKDDVAKLTIRYASVEDYTQFTGIELYVGPVSEAMAAGYDFEAGFVNAEDGKKADIKDIMDEGNLQVAIIKGNVNVCAWDPVDYYSKGNNSMADKKTLAIGVSGSKKKNTEAAETNNTEDGFIAIVPYDTENTEKPGVKETVNGEAVDGEKTDANSISDDEMITGTEEPGKRFVFDRPEATGAKETEDGQKIVSDSYTYVFY